MSIKKKIILITTILLIFAMSYLLLSMQSSKSNTVTPQDYTITATVMRIQTKAITLEKELPGRATPFQAAEIRPQVTGIITDRLFKEGSKVQEGQQLYQIDAMPYQVRYDKAKAAKAKAKANVKLIQAKNNRYRELVKTGAVSKQEYEDIIAKLAFARSEVSIAEAEVTAAKIDLEYTKVYAPISGYIGKSEVTKGALVTANQQQSLATITQLNPIYIDMTQTSTDLIKLRNKIDAKNKIPVKLYLNDANKPYELEGALQFSEVTVDKATGSIQLRALFPNPNRLILPGLFVRAKVQLNVVNTILIPQKAVIHNASGEATVWIVSDENKVNPCKVTVGNTIGDQWIITDGLHPDQVIMLDSFQKVSPGMVITPQYSRDLNQQDN